MFTFNEATEYTNQRISEATLKYKLPSSPQEMLGVMLEEFIEMQQAMHDDDFRQARLEALDLAAACIRFATTDTSRERDGEL
jgi:hypothetical protein